jgi:hypothetical protein
MTRAPTTTFRFDTEFLQFLDATAAQFGSNRTQVLRSSALIVAALFREARTNALADLAWLRERYGDDAELLCGVEAQADGTPLARVLIDGKAPDDFRVRPLVDYAGGVAHLYLDVFSRDRGEAPNILPFAGEWLWIEGPLRLPLGELPWPPQQNIAIKIRLGDLADLQLDEKPERVQPVTV